VVAPHISRQDHVYVALSVVPRHMPTGAKLFDLLILVFSHLTKYLFSRTVRLLYRTLLHFTLLYLYSSTITMTTKQNPTLQRQRPLTVSESLSSLSAAGNLDFTVRSRMPNSIRDRKDQRVFLKSVIDQALEVIEDADDCFSESGWSSEKAEEEKCQSQNRNQ
jgi:hypothetical protein